MENQSGKCGTFYFIRPDDLVRFNKREKVVAYTTERSSGLCLRDISPSCVIGAVEGHGDEVLLQKSDDANPLMDLWMLSSQIAELVAGREAKATTCQRPTDSTIIHGIPLSWVKRAGESISGEVFIQRP
ncbi:MAG: hypothetical protein WC242_01865 [Candidatus Paceibacterota bacterium]|jgi:hypothetical protein